MPAVVALSLRNPRAVAAWLSGQDNQRVAVICAGERWPDGTLRPAVEDLWGAGALVDLFDGRDIAPEAAAAASAFRAVHGDVRTALRACASGRELIDAGYPTDVDVAAELDDSAAVPVLRDGMFVAQ